MGLGVIMPNHIPTLLHTPLCVKKGPKKFGLNKILVEKNSRPPKNWVQKVWSKLGQLRFPCTGQMFLGQMLPGQVSP